ncbi:MAG: OmpA/MotB domain protein [Bacteroidetes bacterium]|jgi:hypothetical protein|nr:OmpA/MotB domain protein [Bacteroidota bacterium]
MKKLFTTLSVVACLGAAAQNYCEKTSIYFELNKSELTHSAQKKLDSLLHTLDGKSYVVELYGYSDSTATTEYNLTLSKKRIESVQVRMKTKSTIQFTYMEKNLGESKSVSGDASLDRRVDIFTFPEKNKMITINSPNESVEVPIDYFEPCGICNSKPEIISYYTAAEASKANIVFKTSSTTGQGEELISAGTIRFTSKPCSQGKSRTSETISLILKSDYVDTEMSVWEPDTVDKVIYWKPSSLTVVFDTTNKQYVVKTDKRFLNIAKKLSTRIVFPKEFASLKSSLFTTSKVRTNETTNDTLLLGKPDSTWTVLSLGKMNGTIYLMNEKLKTISNLEGGGKNFTQKPTYTVPFSLYKEFAYTDTTIRIKFKKSVKPEQFGYYLKDYNEFIPVSTDMKGKYILATKPESGYQLAIIKKSKLYAVDQKKIPLKYSKKKKAYKLKIKSKNITKFKQNKAWTPPVPEPKKKKK